MSVETYGTPAPPSPSAAWQPSALPSIPTLVSSRLYRLLAWAGSLGVLCIGWSAMIIAAYTSSDGTYDSSHNLVVLLIVLGAGHLSIGIYMLPSIVADIRSTEYFWPLCVVNLTLGWTGIGWVAALVWAVWPRRATVGQQFTGVDAAYRPPTP